MRISTGGLATDQFQSYPFVRLAPGAMLCYGVRAAWQSVGTRDNCEVALAVSSRPSHQRAQGAPATMESLPADGVWHVRRPHRSLALRSPRFSKITRVRRA